MAVSQSSDKSATPSFNLPAAYAQLYSRFGWDVPEHYNIAYMCCTRWAHHSLTAGNTAIVQYEPNLLCPEYTFADLQQQANRLSHVLQAQGVQSGDRVAIVMPQSFETAVAYIAVLQMGAIAMPLSLLFGPDALQYRLQDSDAVVAVCDPTSLDGLCAVRSSCPALRCVIGVGALADTDGRADLNFSQATQGQAATWTCAKTRAEDAAVLIYTSGTTGNPKGALIPHRALIGNLSGFICSQNWFGFDGRANGNSDAVFWSPADWAWTGGLMDALLPTLYFGRRIVAYRGRFAPQTALELMGRCGVTHTFLFPTALKAMMKAFAGTPLRSVRTQFRLRLQAIMSAGEAVGDAVFAYCEQQLGVVPNEMFGQTEINYIVGNCAALWKPKPGSMGMGYPGHRVAVIDEKGKECPVGVPGDVALHRLDIYGKPDPIFFLGYWKNEAATRDKFTGDWCRTGDIAIRDGEGYLWYQGRSDDVFKSAGYRIGPGEIENCLVKHPAVANAAVVPKPDAQRGALVKAYVVLAPDAASTCGAVGMAQAQLHERLTQVLQEHVKGLLAPYEYPKEIEFLDQLPMTTTGKVQRRVLRLQEQERARQRG